MRKFINFFESYAYCGITLAGRSIVPGNVEVNALSPRLVVHDGIVISSLGYGGEGEAFRIVHARVIHAPRL